MNICAIASGSNGNCYYIGDNAEGILVDAGLSARQLRLRLESREIDQSTIKAILVTHEHSDHCRGIRVLSNQLQIPVYITKKTFLALHKKNRPDKVRWFDPGEAFNIGSFKIFPFLKSHDAIEACSFRVKCHGKQIGVMTDIGTPEESVQHEFSLCDAVFLESNYEKKMLRDGNYPCFLKERILSGHGHLSNLQAYFLAKSCGGENLKLILLSHLSGENNTPELAISRFKSLQSKYHICLTFRHAATEVFKV